MNLEELTIKSKQDELELKVAIIKPDTEIKGIIQISHGMSEHKERYFPFMEYFATLGYVTIINDHRGHGGSIKRKEDLGYFYDEKAESIVEDLHQITLYIKQRFPNQQLILLGHSMGSMVVRKYIKKYDSDINKLIVCGSPSKNQLVGVALFMVKILKKTKGEYHRSKLIQNLAFGLYNKNTKNNKSKNEWVCANKKVVEEYDKDELCGYIFTTNGFLNLFTLMKDIYTQKGWKLNHKELPILFIAGEDDPVIVNRKKWEKSQQFLKDLGYKNIEGKLYKNMRHEILNEKDNIIVFKDIANWINNIKIEYTIQE